MNKKSFYQALSMALGLSGPYTQINSFEDFKYIDNDLVQDSIWDFTLGLLKYIQDESEESLKEMHQKYLESLNKMNDDEKEYFKNFYERLVKGDTKEAEQNNNLKKERKL